MGAENRTPNPIVPEPRRRPLVGWLLAAAAVMAAVLTFDEVVEWVGGEPRLKK